MRNPERIPVVLDKIRKLWEKYPDLRFFQLIKLIKSECPISDTFYFEDNDLELVLEQEFDV